MWLLATVSDELVTIGVGFVLTTARGDRPRPRDPDLSRAQPPDGQASVSHATAQLGAHCGAAGRVARRSEHAGLSSRALQWNDTLNRNLAAAEIEFGRDVRQQLERDIYEGFEQPELASDTAARSGDSLGPNLNQLRERIYGLGVTMLLRIREGHVSQHPGIATRRPVRTSPSLRERAAASREAGAIMWKRSGSGKPQQSAAAMCGTSLAERSERQTAVDRSSCSRLTSRRSPVRAGHRPSWVSLDAHLPSVSRRLSRTAEAPFTWLRADRDTP